MKKTLLPLIVSLLPLCLSCSDQVNPKTDLRDLYSLNCIMRGDTSSQIVTITHSYQVSGYDPSGNTADPFIGGAKINVYYNDSVFVFRDTSAVRTGISQYTTPIHYYYINKLYPRSGDSIKIVATLPNGQILSASTVTYKTSSIFFSNSNDIYTSIYSSTLYLKFGWVSGLDPRDLARTFFAPDLLIYYHLNSDPAKKQLVKKVAWIYAVNANDQPIYPPIQNNIFDIGYDMANVNRAMSEISGSDPNKSNYIIDGGAFRVLIMDQNLATYYNAQKTFMDEFSVRINEPDFTNIKGGLGIFGTFSAKLMDVPIASDYIQSFGYGY
jgi:Domain of unknown function (DUF4249)